MESCVFCKIVNKEIPANIYFENDKMLAFADINPEAPFHALIIPKKHIIGPEIINFGSLIGEMIGLSHELAKKYDLSGFRIIMNIGPDSGQQIDHIHFHMLGGKNLGPKLIP